MNTFSIFNAITLLSILSIRDRLNVVHMQMYSGVNSASFIQSIHLIEYVAGINSENAKSFRWLWWDCQYSNPQNWNALHLNWCSKYISIFRKWSAVYLLLDSYFVVKAYYTKIQRIHTTCARNVFAYVWECV